MNIEEIKERAKWLVEIVDNPYCLGPLSLHDGVKEVIPFLLAEVDRLTACAKKSKMETKTLNEKLGALGTACHFCGVKHKYTMQVIKLSGRIRSAEAEVDRLNKNSENLRLDYLDERARAERAEAALAESQRREKAAVEDLSTYKDCGFCIHLQDQQYCYKNCQRHVDVDNFRTHPCWQWRGPQTEEGAEHERD